MSALSILLLIKITVTLVFVALPLLILPKERLGSMFGLSASTPYIFRLYGVAMLALITAYASGVWQISQGQYPVGIILMGIISNGGAALAALIFGQFRKKFWLNLFFSTVTAGLVVALISKEFALTPIV